MNKVAIVLSQNIRWSPYYRRYEKLLNQLNIPFDLIMWNREHLKEEIDGSLIEFDLSDKTNDGSIFKVFKFFSFLRFVKKQLSKGKYEKILFLGTYAFIPALLSKFLAKKFKGKYWIDLRDLTYENIGFFFREEKRAIENSFKTVISSKGFLKYLPDYEYGFIHNIDPTMDEAYGKYQHSESKNKTIRVSYIGNLSYWESCKKMIDRLANDIRFEMRFVGPGYERIKDYCDSNDIQNVSFHGRFNREDTVLFYNDTDIIFNVYGNNTPNVCAALSNKLYYSLKFEIPILVSSNTYMEEFCKKYNVGITFKNVPSFPDDLYRSFYLTKDEGCRFNEAWDSVLSEDKNAERMLIEFLETKDA